MIFQQFNLVGRLDVLTNVLLGRLNKVSTVASLLRIWSKDDRAMALSALAAFDIHLQRVRTRRGAQKIVEADGERQGNGLLAKADPDEEIGAGEKLARGAAGNPFGRAAFAVRADEMRVDAGAQGGGLHGRDGRHEFAHLGVVGQCHAHRHGVGPPGSEGAPLRQVQQQMRRGIDAGCGSVLAAQRVPRVFGRVDEFHG